MVPARTGSLAIKAVKLFFFSGSYGVQPPIEVSEYLGSPIHYNTDQLQRAGQVFCSHLCLYVIKELDEGNKFQNDVRGYVDQCTELLGRRFHNLPLAFLKDNGNFVAHTPVSMASQPLNDLPGPKERSDAVTKKCVDDLIADNVGVGNIDGGGSPFFKENGNYQATHSINMKLLLNLSTPSEPYEAATKQYVDDVKKTNHLHIIVVHTHYCGDLRKGEYRFTFGGNISHKLKTGFLLPQSGRIKIYKQNL